MKITVEITVEEDDGTTISKKFSEAQVERSHSWPYACMQSISVPALKGHVAKRFRSSLSRMVTA